MKKSNSIHSTYFALVFLSVLIVFMFFSCSKSSPFGADLLQNEIAEYAFTDSLTIHCKVEIEDSIITADINSTADYQLCGKINDPLIGVHEAEIYSLFQLSTFSPNFRNSDGTLATLDSAVMTLRVAAAGVYGDTTQVQNFKVYQLNVGSRINRTKSYYSTDSYPADREIGSAMAKVYPSKKDSLYYGKGTTQKEFIGVGSVVRIPLDLNFAHEIFDYDRKTDSLVYAVDSLFWDKIRGIKIKTETSNANLITGLALNNTTFSRISFFYKKNNGDTVQYRYHMNFVNGNKFVHFNHDYKNTPAEQSIKSVDPEVLYLHGMSGLRVLVDIPYAQKLGKVAVNKAELEFTTAILPTDNPQFYAPIPQLILIDTSKLLIQDLVETAGSLLTQGFASFGGSPVKTTTVNSHSVYKYRFQMSSRFQDMIDQDANDLKGTRIILNVYPKSITPHRTVFYGQKNSTFPMKLNLKYTKL